MNPKTSEYRKKVADMFVKSLQERELDWKKGWDSTVVVPENAITGKKYRGANRIGLTLYSYAKNLEDPRWATFKQIQDKGWKLKKGSKAMQVEYWRPYDYVNKKQLEWKEYSELLRDPVRRNEVGIIAKYYHVFNGQDIEGIPELEKLPPRQIVSDEIIEKASRNMGVEIINEAGGRAFYRVTEDKIHLPFRESFHSDYEYNATALHELSHATGAAHRLNRNLRNVFGTEEYAYEELVAEISASFMGEHLSIQHSQSHMDNHKAYIQGWIQRISEKPDILFKAIKDADQAANYLGMQAELITQKEYENTLDTVKEVSAQELEPKGEEVENARNALQNYFSGLVHKAGEDIIRQNSEWGAWHGRIVNTGRLQDYVDVDITGMSTVHEMCITVTAVHENQIMEAKQFFPSTDVSHFADSVKRAVDDAKHWFNEYSQDVVKLLETDLKTPFEMYSSHIGRPSSEHYSKLAKAGYEEFPKLREEPAKVNSQKDEAFISKKVIDIAKDLQQSGFRATPTLIGNMRKLHEVSGKEHSLKDVCDTFKAGCVDVSTEEKMLVENIASECKNQELQQRQVPEFEPEL